MTPQRNERFTAIVVGAGLNGLGLIRSLALANISCHLVESDKSDPTAQTRLAERHWVDSIKDDRLIDSLIALAGQLDCKPVLFLTQEAGVRIVSEQRDMIADHYILNLPSREVVRALTTKAGFQRSAYDLNAPIPKTLSVTTKDDISRIAEFRFPVIFKPNEHSRAYSERFRKAYRLESFDEVVKLYDQVSEVEPSIIVQEWIEGDDSDIYFCLQYRSSCNSASLSFCGQKLQSHPPMTGGTASCTIAPKDVWSELTALTNKYFSSAGVTGMCSMEFKRDRNSGNFVMIEPTIGRSDYQEEVATWHGYNIPAIAFQHLTEQPSCPMEEESSCWVWQDKDAIRHYARLQTIGGMGKEKGALFSWLDPYPWIYSQHARILRKIGSVKTRSGAKRALDSKQ